jgi:hypothetical protein
LLNRSIKLALFRDAEAARADDRAHDGRQFDNTDHHDDMNHDGSGRMYTAPIGFGLGSDSEAFFLGD